MSKDERIELGDRVKDRVTGFTGIVVAETTWFNGCRRFTLRAEDIPKGAKISEATDGVGFDEEELHLEKKNVMPCKGRARLDEERTITLAERHTGGPMPNVTQGK